ncbi:glycosyltransferase family 4 protein [Shewanella sp.]|uniref:glycosyltransferase family 4 protein n=1 Tax=Shewanella sp. TaxID=50422 RepID=UPI0040484AAF
MILGIDASNIRAGGGVTHLSELLAAADPVVAGFEKVVVWSGKYTLSQLPDRQWLEKTHVSALDLGLVSRVFWQRFRLSQMAENIRCDVLFVPGGSYAGSYRPMVTMSQNLLPFEWSELLRYGFSRLTLKWMLLRWTQSKTFKHADGVIFLTRFAHDAVIKVIGSLACPTTVVAHGVRDRFAFSPRKQRSITEYSNTEPFRIIYVSIVDMYKHQWHVAEAIAKLRSKGLPIQLDLIGPYYAPALRRLNDVISRYPFAHDYIRYLGPVSYNEMHARYGAADMAVFASSCETFGQIVTEAMSAGLPIACSNRAAMPEILGDSCLYFDPENPEDIANVVEKFIDAPAMRAEKAASAHRRVKDYTWEKCADETLSFLSMCALNMRR